MLLAQNTKLPESNKGQTVILDQRTPEVKQVQASPVIPESAYYWFGVLIFVVIAVIAGISYIVNEKKESFQKARGTALPRIPTESDKTSSEPK